VVQANVPSDAQQVVHVPQQALQVQQMQQVAQVLRAQQQQQQQLQQQQQPQLQQQVSAPVNPIVRRYYQIFAELRVKNPGLSDDTIKNLAQQVISNEQAPRATHHQLHPQQHQQQQQPQQQQAMVPFSPTSAAPAAQQFTVPAQPQQASSNEPTAAQVLYAMLHQAAQSIASVREHIPINLARFNLSDSDKQLIADNVDLDVQGLENRLQQAQAASDLGEVTQIIRDAEMLKSKMANWKL